MTFTLGKSVENPLLWLHKV